MRPAAATSQPPNTSASQLLSLPPAHPRNLFYQEPEAILKVRFDKGEEQFFVKWRNQPESQNSWESRSSLHDFEDKIQAFYNSKDFDFDAINMRSSSSADPNQPESTNNQKTTQDSSHPASGDQNGLSNSVSKRPKAQISGSFIPFSSNPFDHSDISTYRQLSHPQNPTAPQSTNPIETPKIGLQNPHRQLILPEPDVLASIDLRLALGVRDHLAFNRTLYLRLRWPESTPPALKDAYIPLRALEDTVPRLVLQYFRSFLKLN